MDSNHGECTHLIDSLSAVCSLAVLGLLVWVGIGGMVLGWATFSQNDYSNTLDRWSRTMLQFLSWLVC